MKLIFSRHGNLASDNMTSRANSPTSPKPLMPDYSNPKPDFTIDFSTIVHMLTGWQHQLLPTSHHAHVGDLWDFIKDAIYSSHLEEHKERALLIGAAIEDNSIMSEARKKEIEDIGLDTESVYTIKEVRDWKGKKMIKLKNSSPFLAWKGKYGVADKDSWTIDMERELSFPLRERELGDYFWISLEDFAHYFRFVINWSFD